MELKQIVAFLYRGLLLYNKLSSNKALIQICLFLSSHAPTKTKRKISVLRRLTVYGKYAESVYAKDADFVDKKKRTAY